MSDFGIGTIVSIAQFAWDLYSKYTELGEQGRDLGLDIRSMADQLDTSNVFLRMHNEKLGIIVKRRLIESMRNCKATLTMSRHWVKKIERKRQRAWAALVSPDELAKISAKLQKHRHELSAVNQDIDLYAISVYPQNLGPNIFPLTECSPDG